MSNQPFFIDTFREFLDQYNRKEISISKLVEDLNTVAHSWATDSAKKATWTVRDIDLITDYADFDEKAKIKMIEDRIQEFWKDNPSLLTQPADVQERANGMQWVKASEVKLEDQKCYHLKISTIPELAFLGGRYFEERNQFFCSALAGNWADTLGTLVLVEPSPSSMQEENERLRGWLKELTKEENRPHMISIASEALNKQ